ncbi:MAG: Ig-like domain-containing protein, partial [Devosia sp.]
AITADQIDTFVYTVSDADGDLSSTTLSINVANVTLSSTADDDVVVYEKALGTGSEPSNTGETDASNTLVGNVSGGTGSYTFALYGSATGNYGSIVLNSNGTYTYTLTQPFDTSPDANNADQTEDNKESFFYTATDGNGNTVTGTITVDIVDDVPVARADTDTFGASAVTTSIAGNVITGANTDNGVSDLKGADGAKVSGLQHTNGNSDTNAAGDFVVAGQYGTLTLKIDGNYTYLRSSGQAGNDVFTYSLKDGDGDVATSTLTIKLDNSNLPTASNSSVTVDEDDLTTAGGALFQGVGNTTSTGDATTANPVGSFGSYGLDGKGANGGISFSVLDGQVVKDTSNNDVERDGADLKYFWEASTNTLYGTTTPTAADAASNASFKIVVNQTNATYQFTLLKHVDHALGNNENDIDLSIGFKIKDNSGDEVTGVISVKIDDDMPTTEGEVHQVEAGSVQKADAVFIVDVSSSMNDDTISVPGFSDDRIGLARYSMLQMINNSTQLQNILIVRFDGEGRDGVWMDKADAITFINTNSNWNLGNSTNYDAALGTTMSNFAGSRPLPTSPETVVYFLSDGEPSSGGGITGEGSGSQVSISEWEAFVNNPTNKISEVFAVGIGPDVSASALSPVSYPNTDGPDSGSVEDHVILVPNQNDVPAFVATLQGTIDTASITGNVLTNDKFGADGGFITSITINGTPYTWNGVGSPQLTDIATFQGGKLSFNFSTGAWSYDAPATVSQDVVDAFTYTITDGDGDASNATLTINVTEVNHAPVITSNGGGNTASVNVAENSTLVTTVVATDDVGETKTYSIVGGVDAAKFTIDASTGVLSFISAPDFETKTDAGLNNVYDVQVQVSDGSLVDTQSIAVTVTNVNEAPTLMLNQLVSTPLSGQYRDEFGAAQYTNSNGTSNWTGNSWSESGDDNSASGGTIRITGGELRLGDDSNGGNGSDTISRTVNLNGATGATLTYEIREIGLDNGEEVFVLISSTGAAGSFVSLQTIDNDTDETSFTHDISAYATANTVIRFEVQSSLDKDEYVYLDNLNITYSGTVLVPTSSQDNSVDYTENAVAISIAAAGPTIGDIDDT